MTSALDRDAIAGLIPHAGRMCLLDAVLDWTTSTIRCRASSHRDPDNPLSRHGRLGVLCGIEYAAQAMAAHGRLSALGGPPPAAGYLASVRDLISHVDRLDLVAGDLLIMAERLLGNSRQAVYAFALSSAGRPLLEGRTAVLLHPVEGIA
jgi:predicted hotdog family 3-hydroxylacyl-ACP dehydratase